MDKVFIFEIYFLFFWCEKTINVEIKFSTCTRAVRGLRCSINSEGKRCIKDDNNLALSGKTNITKTGREDLKFVENHIDY